MTAASSGPERTHFEEIEWQPGQHTGCGGWDCRTKQDGSHYGFGRTDLANEKVEGSGLYFEAGTVVVGLRMPLCS